MSTPVLSAVKTTSLQAEQARLPAHNEKIIATLENIGKVYRLGKTEVHALQHVNLTLQAKSFTFIVGPSGCGKTTLLNLIGGIDQPTQGSLNILGQALGDLSDDALSDFRSQHIGFIFQNFSLIEVLTAYENIEYPLILAGTPKKERQRIVEEMVTAVGLWERRDHMPEQLSGGQRQRVAIARALVKRPLLVIADEPTANLDTVTSREILELMQSMQQKYQTTFVFSSHDKEMMQYADHVIVVRDGVIESNTRIQA